MIRLIGLILVSYLIGSFPTSYVMGKILKGIDLREHGSGNLGATNVFRVVGKTAGIITLLIDAFKGFIPAFLFPRLIMTWAPELSLTLLDVGVILGVAAILGHMFTLFMKFKGGKGVATSLGVFLALAPAPLLVTVVVCSAIMAATRYVSLGSISGALLLPILIIVLYPDSRLLIIFSLIIGGIIIARHKTNIKRLLQGSENKLRW